MALEPSGFRQKTMKWLKSLAKILEWLKTQNKHLLGWVDQVENHLLTLKEQNSTLVEQHKRLMDENKRLKPMSKSLIKQEKLMGS